MLKILSHKMQITEIHYSFPDPEVLLEFSKCPKTLSKSAKSVDSLIIGVVSSI